MVGKPLTIRFYLLGEVKQIQALTMPAIKKINPRYTPGGTDIPSGLSDTMHMMMHRSRPAAMEMNPPFTLRHLFFRIGSPQ